MNSMEPGVVSVLSARLRRIVAPNPSVMTGPGTNTYLLGERDIAVIDPGPDDPGHVERILAAGGDRIRWVFVTHTHKDHSPAALRLAGETGAELRGMPAPQGDPYQDLSFHPDLRLDDEPVLVTREFGLRAVHTPGHVANHYCLLLEDEGVLLTGDHIMSGSTVVIIPPSGDMRDYLDSLRRLHELPLRRLAPGHGDLLQRPLAEIDAIVRHRLQREAKIVGVLARRTGTLDELVVDAYDDVPAAMHPMAKYSLWAHLIKLEQESRAHEREGVWSAR